MPKTEYSDETKAETLEFYKENGLAAAHKQSGIPKPTILGWAFKSGIESSVVNETALAQTAAAREASKASRLETLESSRQRLTEALTLIAELSAQVQIDALIVGAPDAKLSEVVGAGTRAIHDLLLLTGEATETRKVSIEQAENIIERGRERGLRLIESA